jgi:nucleotide-binding universal stress UspA family protein
MRGTLVCAVSDTDEGRGALETAVEVSDRLGLRLVLAHVAEGIAPIDGSGDDAESVTMKDNREGAARTVARLAAEYGVADTAERRSSIGDPAALVGQIAAEEAADLIVVGARLRGRLRRGLESRLAEQLDSETSVPILIAPPPTRRARKMVV